MQAPETGRSLPTAVASPGTSGTAATPVAAPAAEPPSAARILGVDERLAVTADVGVWVPRLTGTAQVGSGGTQFQLDSDLAVQDSEAAIAGEFAVANGRWRVGGMGYSVSGSGSEAAPTAGTFGSTAIAVGDQLKGSYSSWMAGAEAAYLLWRPVADEPWPWSAEGSNREQASTDFGANGRPLFDAQFLLLGGVLALHYEQDLTNTTTASSSGFDRTVACVYGGAGIDVRLGLDGRVPLVQDVRIYGNAGVGPSIPDGEVIWMVRVGVALLIDENIGVEFGYRLFDFNLVDGPSEVDAGLRGLFGGVAVKF